MTVRLDELHLTVWPATVAPSQAIWLGAERRLLQPAPPATLRAFVGAGPVADDGAAEVVVGRRLSVHADIASEPRGLVIVLAEAFEAGREEFDAWYETEHLPRLGAVDGVLYAARYAVEGGEGRSLALYALRDEDVSQGPAWVEAARTPWTARMRTLTRSFRRLSFQSVAAQEYSVT